jgi:hypothetical protein
LITLNVRVHSIERSCTIASVSKSIEIPRHLVIVIFHSKHVVNPKINCLSLLARANLLKAITYPINNTSEVGSLVFILANHIVLRADEGNPLVAIVDQNVTVRAIAIHNSILSWVVHERIDFRVGEISSLLCAFASGSTRVGSGKGARWSIAAGSGHLETSAVQGLSRDNLVAWYTSLGNHGSASMCQR